MNVLVCFFYIGYFVRMIVDLTSALIVGNDEFPFVWLTDNRQTLYMNKYLALLFICLVYAHTAVSEIHLGQMPRYVLGLKEKGVDKTLFQPFKCLFGSHKVLGKNKENIISAPMTYNGILNLWCIVALRSTHIFSIAT